MYMKHKAFLFSLIFFSLLFCIFSLRTAAVDADGKIVVVLDPGHGGIDPGAVGNGVSEAAPALRIAQYIRQYLEDTGRFAVYLTRTDNNTLLNLHERGLIADSHNADICVSLHFNSLSPSSYHGATVCNSVLEQYAMTALSDGILNRLQAYVGIRKNPLTRTADFGKRIFYWSEEYQWDIADTTAFGSTVSDYYGMIKWGVKFGFDSIIIEHCCLSNPQDAALVKSEQSLKLMAKADADALIAYYTGHTHTYAAERTVDYPTSCLYPGKSSVRCTVCGCRKEVRQLRDAPDPDKHFWFLSETKAAGCETDGYRKYTCRFTENMVELYKNKYSNVHERFETIPATGHAYSFLRETPPGHSKNGEKLYCCANCGNIYSVSVPKTSDHEFILTETKEPTCLASGYHRYSCSCGESYDEEIPPRGHVIKDTEEAPACETAGKRITHCEYCDLVIKTEEIPPLGHNFQDASDAHNSFRQCTRCGIRENIQPLPASDTQPQESDTLSEAVSETAAAQHGIFGSVPARTAILIAGAAVILVEIVIGVLLICRYDKKRSPPVR